MNANSSSKRFFTVLRIGVMLTLLVTLFLVQSSTILAGSTPSIAAASVVPNAKVTLDLYNLPTNSTYEVQMGKRGTGGIGGYHAASFTTGSDSYYQKTFSIPTALYDEALIDVRVVGAGVSPSTVFYNTGEYVAPSPLPGGYGGIPTTSIKSVDNGVSVTLTTYNFPKEKDFTVTIGEYGTRGVGGITVGDFYSAGGGSFELTFSIPEELKDEEMLSIRLETPDKVYYAFDWFYNNPNQDSGGEAEAGEESDGNSSVTSVNANYVGFPTTTILSSVDKTEVEVKVFNLPKDVDFVVTMGKFGTRGVGGTQVDSFNSADGGTQTFTFTVPATLMDENKLAIRLDSGRWYAFDWWVNNPSAAPVPAPAPVTPSPSGWTKIPSTSFVSLAAGGGSVTFAAYNFEPNTEWKVTMGEYGTRGVNGIYIQTLTSPDGSFNITSEIPEALKDLDKIAIRYEQVGGPYYAFDWFNN